MEFGFSKPSSYKSLPWISIISGIFLIALIFFFIKGLAIMKTAFAFDMQKFSKYIEPASVAIGGLDPTVGYAGVILDKALNQGASSLDKNEIMHLLQSPQDPLIQKIITQEFPELSGMIDELPKYAEDLYSLLGYEEEQTYLVVLQNTNEKRPNGGFFGSFAVVKILRGEITHLEIVDSYLPNFDNPNTYITGPERFNNFLPERQIYFIGANKVGYTYHDGAHIKTLYEKSYPGQDIRGVVFLTTDMFEYLLEDFSEQMWEWQFVNAAIDLVRGEERRGKKEFYLKSSEEYFEENKKKIFTGIIDHLPTILEEHWVNMYLVDISGPLHGFIRRNNLTTRFEEETAYLRESNISFNKIDSFVDKNVRCFSARERTLIEKENEDIFSLLPLDTGSFTCKINYSLNVPQSHFDRIAALEEKYNIDIRSREEHILAIEPTWDSRVIFHIPPKYTIEQITGDIYETEIFSTPFSSAAMFKTYIEENGGESNIFITFSYE